MLMKVWVVVRKVFNAPLGKKVQMVVTGTLPSKFVVLMCTTIIVKINDFHPN